MGPAIKSRLPISRIHPAYTPYLTAGTVVPWTPPAVAHEYVRARPDRRAVASMLIAAVVLVLGYGAAVTSCMSSRTVEVVDRGGAPELPVPADLTDETKALEDTLQKGQDAGSEVKRLALEGERLAPTLKQSHWVPIHGHGVTFLNIMGVLIELKGRLDAEQERITTRDEARAAESKAAVEAIKALQDQAKKSQEEHAKALARRDKEKADLIAEHAKALAKERDASRAWERRVFSGLVILGALGLPGAALLGYFFGSKLGGVTLVMAVSCIVTGRVMQFTDRQSWLLDGILLGLIVLGAVIFGLAMWKRRKDLYAKAKEEAKFLRDTIDTNKPESIREYAAKRRADEPLLNVAMEEVKKEESKPDHALVAAVVEVVKKNRNGKGSARVTDEADQEMEEATGRHV